MKNAGDFNFAVVEGRRRQIVVKKLRQNALRDASNTLSYANEVIYNVVYEEVITLYDAEDEAQDDEKHSERKCSESVNANEEISLPN
ncbi:hypothetical protein DOY81_006884 [Sarcophaga bullata]|nr:hypothetical protein DOY81_006884 [Sarcophaga bullata]